MRLFRKQQNLVQTTKAVTPGSEVAITNLTVNFAVYTLEDVLINGSDVTLDYDISTQTYKKIVPELASLEQTDYYVLLEALSGADRVFYFYGLASAIIRKDF